MTYICPGTGQYPLTALREYVVDRSAVPRHHQNGSGGSGNASHGRCAECGMTIWLDTQFLASEHSVGVTDA